MDKLKKEKIKLFLDDSLMSDTVFEILSKSFAPIRANRTIYPEVQFLAAERIAADLLIEGWKALKQYQVIEDEEVKEVTQIGL